MIFPSIFNIFLSGINKETKYDNQLHLKAGEPMIYGITIIKNAANKEVAIKSIDTESEKIEKRLSRRDEWEGDLSGIHFDSYFDKRTSFVFAVSAGGVKNDGFFSNDGDGFDDSWDPIWNVKTKITTVTTSKGKESDLLATVKLSKVLDLLHT